MERDGHLQRMLQELVILSLQTPTLMKPPGHVFFFFFQFKDRPQLQHSNLTRWKRIVRNQVCSLTHHQQMFFDVKYLGKKKKSVHRLHELIKQVLCFTFLHLYTFLISILMELNILDARSRPVHQEKGSCSK